VLDKVQDARYCVLGRGGLLVVWSAADHPVAAVVENILAAVA